MTAEGVDAHTGGTATCEKKAACTVCGKEYGELADHTYVDGKCECRKTDPNYTTKTDEPNAGTSGDPDFGNTGEPSDKEDGLGAGAIVGIAVGSAAVVGLGGFSLFRFVIKKKKWSDLIGIFKK